MFLLLAHLQAGQVGIFELQVVFLTEVLRHCSLHSLSVLQLQRKPDGNKYLRRYKGNNLELVRTYFGALIDLKLFWFLTCWKKLQINKQNKKRCKMANRSWAHLKLPLLRAPFTHVWWLAGRRVTLHTLYFRLMVPQCVTSTFRPEQKEYRFKLRSDILHNPKLQHLQSFRFDMLFWVVDGTACTQGNTNWKMSSCWINLGSHRGSHIDFLFSYLNYRSL